MKALVTLALALLISAAPAAAEHDPHDPHRFDRPVVVGFNAEYYPLEFINGRGEPDGFVVELIEKIADIQGFTVTFVSAPWQDLLADFRNRKIDMLAAVFPSPRREDHIAFTSPVGKLRYHAYVMDSSPIHDPGGIREQVVAMEAGDDVGRRLVESGQVDTLFLADSISAAFAALVHADVPVAVLPAQTARALIEDQRTSVVRELNPPLYVLDYHIGVHSGDRQLLQAMNSGLTILESTGEYGDLADRWYTEPGSAMPEHLTRIMALLGATTVSAALIGGLWTLMLRRQVLSRTKEIRRRREMFDIIADQSTLGIFIISPHRVLYANDAMAEVMNTDSTSDLETVFALVHPDDRNRVRTLVESCFSGSIDSFTSTFRLAGTDNPVRHVEINTGIGTYRRRPALIGAATDVTERETGWHALAEEQQIFTTLFEHAPVIVAVYDRNGIRQMVNGSYEEFTGCRSEDVVGRHVSEGPIHPEDVDHIARLIPHIRPGDKRHLRSRLMTADGSVALTNLALAGVDQNTVVAMGIDVTDEVLNEQLLIRQGRLAAMGQMLDVIAHQWRQPLNALSVYLSSLKSAVSGGRVEPSVVEEVVGKAGRQVSILTSTIHNFRDLVKPGGDTELFNTAEAVERVVSMLEPQMRHAGITVEVNVEDSGRAVMNRGRKNEFMHAVLNVLINAREAIEASNPAERVIHIDMTAHTTHFVIEVSDTGGGIPEDIMDRVYEPYYSTKEGNVGIGIGLYLVRRTVESVMNGSMEISNTRTGAMVRIILPPAPSPHRHESAAVGSAPAG